jgi:uncharacterized membrane protein YwaF
MSPPVPSPGDEPREQLDIGRVLTWWFALMSLGGLLLGGTARRQLSALDIILYSLLVSAAALGTVLAVLRLGQQRPLGDVISSRKLIAACAVSIAAFLIGAWLGTELAALP